MSALLFCDIEGGRVSRIICITSCGPRKSKNQLPRAVWRSIIIIIRPLVHLKSRRGMVVAQVKQLNVTANDER